MAIIGETQKLPEDWDRIDCSRMTGMPWETVKIGANRFATVPGGSVSLFVRGAHSLCQDHCYKWRIVRGGGELSDLYGKRVVYYAPAEQPECTNLPIIQLEYCGEYMDQAVIGISSVISEEVAYFSAGPFTEGMFPQEGHCRQYKIEPGTYIFGEWNPAPRDPTTIYESVAWCGQERIQKCCVTIRRHACDGRELSREAIGIRNT